MNCIIKPDFKKLKFKAIFPNKLKEELENEEEIEEKENEENNKHKKNNEFKDCEIKIEFFEFINGGYEVHFNKGKGNFSDYYSYFMDIKKYIKKILQ